MHMIFRFALLHILLFVSHLLADQLPYKDTSLSASERAEDLVSRLTLSEKIAQLGNRAPAIPRLDIKAYNYWNEACHGVVEHGTTVFPQTIGLSATWDTALIGNIYDAIASEARVLHRSGKIDLTFFTPTINMARDPRWGRNEETYGEDPFLARKMARTCIRRLQGNHPRYLKTAATAKHFICNNREDIRRWHSSDVDERSLREYYLPVFKTAVDAGVSSIMSAYNALNGIPCSANKWLLSTLLRDEWGFKGYIVSDCEAITYLTTEHHFTHTPVEAAALACKSGCDLECGQIYQRYLPVALSNTNWALTEATLDTALKRIFTSRFRLGEFDPPDQVPYNAIPASACYSEEHRSLSLEAARESIVLLKNNSILPLKPSMISSVAIIGPFANRCELGGYSGVPAKTVTPLQGIAEYLKLSGNATVSYAYGCSSTASADFSGIDKAVNAAVNADVAIVFIGTGPENAREQHDLNFNGLPGAQLGLVKAVFSANSNTIVVLVTGNPLPIVWLRNYIPAILVSWYGGPYQGHAIADVLFGTYNPSGKLTQTWVDSEKDLPPFNDYSIFNNRTYMYSDAKPLFPFGHGLSYTTFAYDNLSVSSTAIREGDTLIVSADITNVGDSNGTEIVQLYIRDVKARVPVAKKQLAGFSRVSLSPGETKTVTFPIPFDELSYWDIATQTFIVEPGTFDVIVGKSSSDSSLTGQFRAIRGSSRNAGDSDLQHISLGKQGTHSFTLRTPSPVKFHIDIIGLNGRRYLSRDVYSNRSYQVPTLPSGIYLTRISGNTGSKLIRVLIGK